MKEFVYLKAEKFLAENGLKGRVNVHTFETMEGDKLVHPYVADIISRVKVALDPDCYLNSPSQFSLRANVKGEFR